MNWRCLEFSSRPLNFLHHKDAGKGYIGECCRSCAVEYYKKGGVVGRVNATALKSSDAFLH